MRKKYEKKQYYRLRFFVSVNIHIYELYFAPDWCLIFGILLWFLFRYVNREKSRSEVEEK